MQHPCVCKCEQVVGVTYRDDIQDAEEAVDAITWVNLLHHTFFAILEARNKHINNEKKQVYCLHLLEELFKLI